MNANKIYNFSEMFEKLAAAKAKKHDPKAAIRNRGKCCLPAEHSMVTDDKDHYPIHNEAQARNALSRVNQHKSAPPWFKGSLKQLINIVYRKVHSAYPGIEYDPKKKKPGKG